MEIKLPKEILNKISPPKEDFGIKLDQIPLKIDFKKNFGGIKKYNKTILIKLVEKPIINIDSKNGNNEKFEILPKTELITTK